MANPFFASLWFLPTAAPLQGSRVIRGQNFRSICLNRFWDVWVDRSGRRGIPCRGLHGTKVQERDRLRPEQQKPAPCSFEGPLRWVFPSVRSSAQVGRRRAKQTAACCFPAGLLIAGAPGGKTTCFSFFLMEPFLRVVSSEQGEKPS